MFKFLFNSRSKNELRSSDKALAETLQCHEAQRRSYSKTEPMAMLNLLDKLSKGDQHCRKVGRHILDDEQVIHDITSGTYLGCKLLKIIDTYTDYDKTRILSRPRTAYHFVVTNCGTQLLDVMKSLSPDQQEQVWDAQLAWKGLVDGGYEDRIHAMAPDKYASFKEKITTVPTEAISDLPSVKGPYTDAPGRSVVPPMRGPYHP